MTNICAVSQIAPLGLLSAFLVVNNACAVDPTASVSSPIPTELPSTPVEEQFLPSQTDPSTTRQQSTTSTTRGTRSVETATMTVSPTSAMTSSPPSVTHTPDETVVHVEVGEYFVTPHVLTLTVGTKVEWVPVGDREHTIISMDGTPGWPRDGSVGSIGSPPFWAIFRTPGVYEYFCSVHPSVMDGTIVVIQENGDMLP